MGGCPSLSWNARKIVPLFQAFSSSSNGTSGALSALDECLLLIFKHVGREKALQSIFQNSTALPTFIKYMSLKGADKVEALLKRAIRASVDRNTSLQQCSFEQYYSDAANNMLDEMDPQCRAIFDVMCEMLPSYLHSDFYQEWRYRERLEACQALLQVQIPETTLPELSFNPEFSELATADANLFNNIKAIVTSVESVITISDSCCKVRKDSLDSHMMPKATLHFRDSFTISNLYNSSSLYQALEHCDPMEASKLLHSRSWLPIFLAMAETLPIGVSLSRVQADHNDFPVIYMNKYLEKLYGFERQNFIDYNLNLSHIISIHNDIHINNALTKGLPLVITSSNQNIHGVTFNNMVGIKPVYDNNFQYKYVIAIHMEIQELHSNSHIRNNNWRFIYQLMDMMPEPGEYIVVE